MRIMLIWPDSGPETNNMIRSLGTRGHVVVYWVGLPGSQNKGEDLIFHNHYSALAGGPAVGIEVSRFSPPGRDLIKKMVETEAVVLTMMDKRFDRESVDERKHIYYTMLGYWYGVMGEYRPEAVIFNAVPHSAYAFIIYELARIMGVKTVMLEDSWVSDRLLLYTDWVKGSTALREELQRYRGRVFSPEDLSDDLREYYLKQRDPQGDATPVYTAHWQKHYSGMNRVRLKLNAAKESVKDGTIAWKFLRYILNRTRTDLKREYQRFVSAPDFSQQFVYVPLSFQPERTTSPQGGVFVDQILMVEILAAALPHDWLLYVKEHPNQWRLRSATRFSSARYPGYYRRLARIRNVRLVPVHTDTYRLTQAAQAVAVATGTAGWEAVLRSKPALVFGYPWYRDCPALFRVHDAQSCRAAFAAIANGCRVDQQTVINYLKAFDESTIHAYIESLAAQNSSLTKQESFDHIVAAISKELEE